MESLRLAESGLDRVGLAGAPELLCSATRAMEGLAAEIQSCDQSKLAPKLQELKADLNEIWGAEDQHKALALHARDAAHAIGVLEDMMEYRRLAGVRYRRRPSNLLMLWRGSSKTTKLLKAVDAVAQGTRKIVRQLASGAAPPPDSGGGGAAIAPPKQHLVLGRDKDRDEIVQMLVEPNPRTLVSIVGAAGVGKTTLAQLVFNDARVEQSFDVTSWVSVSRDSGKAELTAEILRSAQPAWDGSADTVLDFQMLQSQLRQFVASKRYLIVLDGVSAEANSPDEIWRDILLPLQSAHTGSRILVTSRTNMLPASQLYTLDPLDSDNCWALLKEHALGSDSNDVLHMISAKTRGSPLAAKLVGGALGATGSTSHWMNVMETGSQDDAVVPALRLSYRYLPGHLKRCFAYCSLFPHNWKFDRAQLVRLWIAEGYVQPQSSADKMMEDRATEYFDQLLSRSFFHELKLGSKTYYLLHDLLHDLAQSVAADDCCRIEQGMSYNIPPTVRHLSVTMKNLHALTSFCGLDKLRTLLIQRSVSFSPNCCTEDFMARLKYLLKKTTNMRVLDLSGFNLKELPQSIGDLLQLRYLYIPGSIQSLPESIGKLLHLQTLWFTEKCSLDKLPAGITMLVNLRHLGVEIKYTAGLVGIGRLANLHGSLELHVEKWGGRTLEELRNINGLHGSLKIKGLENVASNQEACKAELIKKSYLNSLNLEWSFASRNLHPPADDAEVLEGLQPHPDIRELRIRRYCGITAPSWLQSQSLQQLRYLKLINCRSLDILPPLGHLRSLEYLHMKELCAVDQIGHEFYGNDEVVFPSLTVLEIDDFPRLHKWIEIEDRNSFPCLERLKLVDCPKLVRIPSLPPTTTEVTIERTQLIPYMRLAPLSSSSEMLQLHVCTTSALAEGLLHKRHIESVVDLNISGAEQVVVAEELTFLVSLKRLQLSQCYFTDETFSRFLQALPCLFSLEIVDLPNVTSFPASRTLQFRTMLSELCIRNCQLLCSLSSLQFFDSVKYLVIERCPKVTAVSFPVNFRSLLSLKVLRISYCSELQSLPVCGLPSSLETLQILGCHRELFRQTRNRGGHCFEMLAMIPRVLIQ